jgi:hypothetical protein
MPDHLTYLSLGAGVQSTALLVMSAKGLHGVPKADVAIFADTQDEEPHTYELLEWCVDFGEKHGIPVRTPTKGKLSDGLLKATDSGAFPTPPLYTVNPDGSHGFTRRKCTTIYKIGVIEREAKNLLGVKKGQRVKAKVTSLQGISTDEIHRMKDSPHKWLTIRYPLIDAGLSRADSTRFMREGGYPVPERSACYYCPFHSPSVWQDMKVNRPETFERACQMDEALRDLSQHGFTGTMYLHASRVPLREVDFLRFKDVPGQGHLFDMDGFGNECEGMCGV